MGFQETGLATDVRPILGKTVRELVDRDESPERVVDRRNMAKHQRYRHTKSKRQRSAKVSDMGIQRLEFIVEVPFDSTKK